MGSILRLTEGLVPVNCQGLSEGGPVRPLRRLSHLPTVGRGLEGCDQPVSGQHHSGGAASAGGKSAVPVYG